MSAITSASYFPWTYGSDQPVALDYSGATRAIRSASLWLVAFMPSVGSSGPPYVPPVGPSPTIVDKRPFGPWRAKPAQVAAKRALPLSASKQAQELLVALSLSKSQLAQVLRITRPTLYEWLGGKQPSAANAARLDQLHQLLVAAGVRSVRSPLNARFVRQVLPGHSCCLLDALCAQPLDTALVQALLAQALDLTRQANTLRIEREHRLRDQGFESPSHNVRAQQLAHNTMLPLV